MMIVHITSLTCKTLGVYACLRMFIEWISVVDMVRSRAAHARMRWFAAWVLFAAFWPLILLYLVWIPLSIMKKFPEDRQSLNRPLHNSNVV